MNFNIKQLSSLSENELEIIMNELQKNPLILIPHYLLKSELLNLIEDEVDDMDYLELRELVKHNLYTRVQDSIDNNLEDWL
jgi:hypothetical protein